MLSLDAPTAVPGADVVGPGDPGYDDLRAVHNAMIDRRPAAVVRARDAADVAAAIAGARERGLPLTARGGGHSGAGHGTVEGGVVIDLRAMDGVHVDPERMTVRVGGGATWGAVDAATQAHGLAVTGGRHPGTGVAGVTLGSGSGWLERAMGLTSDNLVAARLVTADGREVVASPAEHPDLHWGLRGGGGNFGVVCELELRCMPLGPTVVGGLRGFPAARAREVLAAYAEVVADAPDALCGGALLMTAPPAPFVPEAVRGEPIVAILALWAGDPAGAAAGLAPLEALGTPLFDGIGPMAYTALQRLLTPPPGAPPMRSYVKFGVLDDLDAPAVDALADLGTEQLPPGAILLQPLGGALGRVAEGESALGDRDAAWAYQLLSLWADPRQDASQLAWTRAASAELRDHGRPSSWPNYVADDDGRRLAVPYAEPTLERLREVKRTWDPANVFTGCHNIRP